MNFFLSLTNSIVKESSYCDQDTECDKQSNLRERKPQQGSEVEKGLEREQYRRLKEAQKITSSGGYWGS